MRFLIYIHPHSNAIWLGILFVISAGGNVQAEIPLREIMIFTGDRVALIGSYAINLPSDTKKSSLSQSVASCHFHVVDHFEFENTDFELKRACVVTWLKTYVGSTPVYQPCACKLDKIQFEKVTNYGSKEQWKVADRSIADINESTVLKSFEDTPFADYKTAPSIHRNDGRLQEGVLRIYSGNEIVANGKYNLTKGDFLNSARNALSCELHLNEPVGSKEEGEVTFTGGISIVSKEICCKLGRLTVTRAGKMSRAILTETAKNIVLQKSDLKKTTGDGLPSFYREMPLE